MKIIYFLLILVFLLVGLFSPFVAEYLNLLMGTNISINNFDSNYLLTVVSSVATLASIFFVIYGWYSIKELPSYIEKNITEKLSKETDKINKQFNDFAEASQKMNAVYGIIDPDQKINLIQQVLEKYPDMFNARITLAYTYWYDKKDYDKAEEWFDKELQANPDNVNALCDLVALYDFLNESRRAIANAKRAINIDANTKIYLLNDSRLKLETKETISSI